MQGVSITRAGEGSPVPATIEAGHLRLQLDPVALRLDLADAQSGLALSGLAPHVDVRVASDPRDPGTAGAGVPGPARWLAIGEVKAAAGPALRVEVQVRLARGLGLRWTLEVPAAGTGVASAVALENRGAGPVRVHALAPLTLAPARSGLALASIAPCSLDSLPVRVLRAPATCLVVGFTTALHGDGRVELDRAEPKRGFRLETLTEPITLLPGVAVESERSWLGVGEDETALLVEWVRRAAAEMDARVPLLPDGARDGTGWTRTAAVTRSELAAVHTDASTDRGRYVAWTTATPTLSGVGLVDALALPSTPGPAWVSRALDLAFTGRRLWLLDPGAALQPGTAAPTEAERTRLCTCALLGGAPFVEADPARLDPERARWLELVTPPLGRGSHARRVAGGRALVTPLPGGRTIVLLVNESNATTPVGVDFAELGLRGRHHLFDFWAALDCGVRDDGVVASPVCAGGSRLLALTPVADRPTVIGTTLHVGMGALEVSALRSDGAGALSLVLRLPGRRRGAVWIAVPGERESRRVEVEFTDALTVAVLAPGARDSGTAR